MLSKNLLVWNSTALILMLGSLVIRRIMASEINILRCKNVNTCGVRLDKRARSILAHVTPLIYTCEMSRKLFKLVLVDPVNLLAVGVHIAVRINKRASFVKD